MVNVLVEADAIYRESVFDGLTGLGFVVHSAVIYATTGGGNPTPASNYPDGSTIHSPTTEHCTRLASSPCPPLHSPRSVRWWDTAEFTKRCFVV
jgi:hypothetical protein